MEESWASLSNFLAQMLLLVTVVIGTMRLNTKIKKKTCCILISAFSHDVVIY